MKTYVILVISYMVTIYNPTLDKPLTNEPKRDTLVFSNPDAFGRYVYMISAPSINIDTAYMSTVAPKGIPVCDKYQPVNKLLKSK